MDSLSGISARATSDAWAAGYYINPTTQAHVTLVMHWNGASWTKVASPNPAGSSASADVNFLGGVYAGSATDTWAVGAYGNEIAGDTLVIRWNGTSWTKA